jgi:hypothetical protein
VGLWSAGKSPCWVGGELQWSGYFHVFDLACMAASYQMFLIRLDAQCEAPTIVYHISLTSLLLSKLKVGSVISLYKKSLKIGLLIVNQKKSPAVQMFVEAVILNIQSAIGSYNA